MQQIKGTDYAAIMAEREGQKSVKSTLDDVVRDHIADFEGFARVGAQLDTASAHVANAAGLKLNSVRRTFHKLYGKWDAFGAEVRARPLEIQSPPHNTQVELPTEAITWG